MTQRSADQVKVTETKDGSVKVTQPKGKRHHGVTVLLDSDDVLREQVGGFTNFLREYAVVGLALGFIVGQQANAVVKQLVASFLDPFFQVWFGQSLSGRTATLHHYHTAVKVPWGLFVYTLLEFFFVLFTLYLLVKLFRLDRFAQKKDSK